jgi:glutathione S-transferase
MNEDIVFFHAPKTRSSGTLALLEELGATYDMHVLNFSADEQHSADYLAINPMGKVPAIRHRGALITEQPAVFMYLADLHPQASLAPTIDDPLRGPYLRWMTFYGSSFEPAVVDKAMQREPGHRAMCPYGDYDTMLKTLLDQLAQGPFLLGERFTAADVLWANALNWTVMFKLVPDVPLIRAYIERVTSRPAFQRAVAKDAELAAAQAA